VCVIDTFRLIVASLLHRRCRNSNASIEQLVPPFLWTINWIWNLRKNVSTIFIFFLRRRRRIDSSTNESKFSCPLSTALIRKWSSRYSTKNSITIVPLSLPVCVCVWVSFRVLWQCWTCIQTIHQPAIVQARLVCTSGIYNLTFALSLSLYVHIRLLKYVDHFSFFLFFLRDLDGPSSAQNNRN
jgi:hypothetical protein